MTHVHPAVTPARLRRVEIVLDFVCVHCYLGYTRYLRAARRYRAAGGEVETVFRPFQLDPGAPATGEPLFEVHRRDRGETEARRIAADRSIGAGDGLEINLARAVFTNTFDAHRLLAHACAEGRGEEMTERLFRAYFTDGVNIADPDTLALLAKEAGVTRLDHAAGTAEFRTELDRVGRLGIRSVPVFRFRDGRVLTGDQSEATFRAALDADPARRESERE